MTTPALETQKLRVRFGAVTAVDGVDLRVESGELVGLIGANGAGKTTFIDAVTGFVPATGSVLVEGRDVSPLPAHRRVAAGLSRTFQSLELFDDLTVRENLLVAAEQHRWWTPLRDAFGRARSAANSSVDEALEVVGLGNVADRHPTELSHGARKLVAVARSVAMRSPVLLLDEPAAGLDSDESRQLGERLAALVHEGRSMLLVDHDMGLVLSICHRVYVLDRGAIIAEGAPASIRNDDAVVAAYLGDES